MHNTGVYDTNTFCPCEQAVSHFTAFVGGIIYLFFPFRSFTDKTSDTQWQTQVELTCSLKNDHYAHTALTKLLVYFKELAYIYLFNCTYMYAM